jgi:hypothetical protein
MDCSVSIDEEVSATPTDKDSRCSRFLENILSVSQMAWLCNSEDLCIYSSL